MATTNVSAPSESTATADELCQEMRRIRRDLGNDVELLVEQAERLMDWRYYVNRYPWAMLGVASFVGYYLVPQRNVTLPTDERTLERLAQRLPIVVQQQGQAKKQSWLNGLLAAGAGLAMRAAMNYVGQEATKMLQQRQAEAQPVETP
jgi:hypothetical protein